jgi:hypothetical protein
MQAALLAEMLEDEEDWMVDVSDVLARFEDRTGRNTLYSIVFW